MQEQTIKRVDSDRMITGLFLRLLPLQIMLAALSFVNVLVDGMFASNLIGSAAMSAIGLYNPVNLIISTIGTALFGGTQVVCGRLMGKNQAARTSGVFSLNILVSCVAGLAVGAVMLAGTGPIASLLGANAQTLPMLKDYLVGSAFSIVPLFLSQQLTSFLSIVRQEKRSTIAVAFFILSNVVLDWFFISVLELGLLGLALATAASYVVFCCALAAYFFKKDAVIRFRPKEIVWGDLGEILKVGYVSALSTAYQVIRGFIMNHLLLRYGGNDAIAAFAAYNTFSGLLWSLPAGILAVYRLLCSISAGEEDTQTLTDVTRVAVVKMGAVMLLLSTVCFLLAVPFTRIFYRDAASTVYAMALYAFRIIPWFYLGSLICILFVAYGQVMRKHALVQVLSFLDGFGGTVLCSLALAPALGYLAVFVSQVCNGALTTLAIVLLAWVSRGRFPRGIPDLMDIPASFGVPEEDRLDISVTSMEEVVLVSERVQRFAAARGIEDRRGYLGALCMEEMAGNILKHGFEKDTRKHTVDIRVSAKEDDLILRIKDDCIAFDPLEQQKLYDSADPFGNIGIRMVAKLARNMDYQNMLGLNVLTIRI